MLDILLKIKDYAFVFLRDLNPTISVASIIAIIFYLGNRINKGFEIDKDIELIRTELENENPDRLLGSANALLSNFDYQNLKDRYLNKKKIAEVKIEYLKKIKKYRWFFYKKFE